jgi:hypothetical protein
MGRGQVLRIGGLQRGRLPAQAARQGQQRGVLGRRAGRGHRGGCRAGGGADMGHVGGDIGQVHGGCDCRKPTAWPLGVLSAASNVGSTTVAPGAGFGSLSPKAVRPAIGRYRPSHRRHACQDRPSTARNPSPSDPRDRRLIGGIVAQTARD